LERRRYPMAGIGDRKASIGWLIRQAQEMAQIHRLACRGRSARGCGGGFCPLVAAGWVGWPPLLPLTSQMGP
jgi:hypothetical protein